MNDAGRDHRLRELARLSGLLSWRFLLLGVKHQLISTSTVVEEAGRALAEINVVDEQLLTLASHVGCEEAEIMRSLTALADRSVRVDAQPTRDAWRYVILRDLRETETDSRALLEKVAAVYRDFDYPSDMRDAVYYMPPIGHENARVGAQLVSPLSALDTLLDRLARELGKK